MSKPWTKRLRLPTVYALIQNGDGSWFCLTNTVQSHTFLPRPKTPQMQTFCGTNIVKRFRSGWQNCRTLKSLIYEGKTPLSSAMKGIGVCRNFVGTPSKGPGSSQKISVLVNLASSLSTAARHRYGSAHFAPARSTKHRQRFLRCAPRTQNPTPLVGR